MCPVLRRWAAVVAIGLAVVASVPASAAPKPTGPAGYVMFSWWRDHRQELALVAPDGTVRSLASGSISRAAWSPDGKAVVMARYEGKPPDAPSQLWPIDEIRDQGRISPYTEQVPGTQDLDPTWSPSGVTIAFVRRSGGSARVWYVGGSTTREQPAASEEHPGTEYWPKFSPSGLYVAFLRAVDQRTDLVVVRVNTREEWTVTTSGTVTQGYAWAPDDSLVYVDGDRTHSDLFAVQNDGTGTKQLTDDGNPKFTPEVSPNGKQVAYTQVTPSQNIQLLNLRDRSVQEITQGRRRHLSPTWSPDGRYLAYLDAPLEQAKLIEDEKPTSIVRVDVKQLDREPHVLVTGKTEVIPITWQPAPGGTFFPTGGKIPFPR